jgi:transcriptional regulator with XRE-family HTH domain
MGPKNSPAICSCQEPGYLPWMEVAHSLPGMKKRPLTAAESEAAAELRAALVASGKTQEEVGHAVGVTQGMVWQWASGKLPVPARRAPALAQILGETDPGRFSVAYRDLVPPKILVREESSPHADYLVAAQAERVRRAMELGDDRLRAAILAIVELWEAGAPREAAHAPGTDDP